MKHFRSSLLPLISIGNLQSSTISTWLLFPVFRLPVQFPTSLTRLEFDPPFPGEPKLKGENILTTILGVRMDHSKWWDLTAVVIILMSYRVLFFTILKLRERTSPLFRRLYTKRTLHHLEKRPSVRKKPSFPSKRHQTLNSLSSQEGLNSPLH
ncbi:hypothetical protein VitviT2T_008925 [Vitis vinifera]|uniref:Uncharacterized protein n=1 Tax=Vitis vinifera TaxID=29760 RepID=A0ABY9C432_VITVI|nr:hypothetical protein VitviT2T_008925 [Vitis vinifera]